MRGNVKITGTVLLADGVSERQVVTCLEEFFQDTVVTGKRLKVDFMYRESSERNTEHVGYQTKSVKAAVLSGFLPYMVGVEPVNLAGGFLQELLKKEYVQSASVSLKRDGNISCETLTIFDGTLITGESNTVQVEPTFKVNESITAEKEYRLISLTSMFSVACILSILAPLIEFMGWFDSGVSRFFLAVMLFGCPMLIGVSVYEAYKYTTKKLRVKFGYFTALWLLSTAVLLSDMANYALYFIYVFCMITLILWGIATSRGEFISARKTQEQ